MKKLVATLALFLLLGGTAMSAGSIRERMPQHPASSIPTWNKKTVEENSAKKIGDSPMFAAGLYLVDSPKCGKADGIQPILASPDLFPQIKGETIRFQVSASGPEEGRVVNQYDTGDKRMIYICYHHPKKDQEVWLESIMFHREVK